MPDRIRIMVCGDAGPARHALLSRSDIQILWTDTAESALAIARSVRPALCLVRPRLEEGSGPELIRALKKQGGPPTVALLLPGEWDCRTECLAAGAAEVVEMERSQAVLQIIARMTGLAFAQDPRVPYLAKVQISVEGQELIAETVNLSISGTAIRNLPPYSPGTLVTIKFSSKEAPVIWGHVMRCWSEGGVPMAGLRFVGVAKAERAWLQREIERHSRGIPRPRVDLAKALFGDLVLEDEVSTPLCTSDLEPPDKSVTVSVRLDPRLPLEQWLNAKDDAARAALNPLPWVEGVAQGLTEIERVVAIGKAGPNWAERSLDLRVRIAEARQANRDGSLDPELQEEASQLFAALRHNAHGQADEVVAQIAEVRAALLRELMTPTPSRVEAPPELDEQKRAVDKKPAPKPRKSSVATRA